MESDEYFRSQYSLRGRAYVYQAIEQLVAWRLALCG